MAEEAEFTVCMIHSYLDYWSPLMELLCKHKQFDWMPNEGNWGDSMIRAGAELLFTQMALVFRRIKTLQHGKILVYGGGGAWCQSYDNGKKICLKACRQYEKVIVLPSSYDFSEEVPSNLILCARDRVSEEKTKIPAVPDLAFLLQRQPVAPVANKLNAWRTDYDAHQARPAIPIDNLDVARMGGQDTPVEPLLRLVGQYREVETDRMHVGIAAAIQGVEKLVLRPNRYHKLQSSFETFPQLYPRDTVFKCW